MAPRVLGHASAVLRRLYRAVVPRGLRTVIRGWVTTPAEPRRAAETGPYRFVLPLPNPDPQGESASGRRSDLLIEAPRKLYVTRQLHEGGFAGYEAPTAAVMLGLADWLDARVVLDVGANVGPYALLLPALLDLEVIAFEPAADLAAVLRHNGELNGVRCTVVETALGRDDGSATLFLSPTDTSNSLREGFRPQVGEVSVPVRRLDTFVEERGITPSLIKIDTETTEPDVLRGAARVLEARPWIVCEVLPGWTEDELAGILLPLGYLAFQIVESGRPRQHAQMSGQSSFAEPNWMFAPVTPPPALWDSIDRWRLAIDGAGPPHDAPLPVGVLA